MTHGIDWIDVVTTKNWFSGRRSTNVNNYFQRPDLGVLVSLEASRPTDWGFWGAEPPRKKGSYILWLRVVFGCIWNPIHKLEKFNI